MNRLWLTIFLAAAISATLKAIGPIANSKTQLGERQLKAVQLLSPCILAAIVATEVFSHERHLQLGAQLVGVSIGGYLYTRTRKLTLAIASAAAITALFRFVS
jgi:branched-subunit amino acid transport protein